MGRLLNIFFEINLFGLLSFFVFLFFSLFGVYIYVKNGNNRVKYLLSLLFFSFCIWSLGHSLLLMSEPSDLITKITPESNSLIYSFNALSSFGYCTIWSFVVNLFIVLIYDKLKTSHKIIIFFNYLISFIDLMSVLFGDNIPKAYTKSRFGWGDSPNTNSFFFWFYSFFLFYWIIQCLYYAIKFKTVSKKNGNKNQEKQAKIILNTGLITVFLIVIFNHILPAIGISFPAIGSAVVGIWLFGLGYSITEYNFLVPTLEHAGARIFKMGGEISVITDTSYKITDVNDAFVNKLGYNEKEIKRLSLSDLFFDKKDILLLSEFKAGTAVEKEVSLKKKNGEKIYTNLKISFIYSHDIQIGATYLFSDITLLKNQNEILEEKVKIRTKEILEAKNEAVRRLGFTEKYTSRSVVNIIERGEDPTIVPSENKIMAILFADIRDFASISENMTPGNTKDMLNFYFSRMNRCIAKNEGEIDKIMGDGLMARFYDPTFAVKAAIEIRKNLPNANDEIQLKHGVRLNNGIGINYGNVVWGNLGSDEKLDLTVTGDVVNAASRIEQLTKHYHLPILISEEVKNSLDSDIKNIRFIDEVLIVGKKNPAKIFEVFDYERQDIILMKQENQPVFEEAFELYKIGRFENALKIYLDLESKMGRYTSYPNLSADPVVNFYIERCKEFARLDMSGGLNNWTGVYSFLTK